MALSSIGIAIIGFLVWMNKRAQGQMGNVMSIGRSRAKARGVRLGRKPKLTPHQQREAATRRAHGEPVTEIARSYNVSHSTISRLPEIEAPHA